jgi:hypothetical protein
VAVELHKHQQEAVDKMHNGCVLYGGVGTGKSITSLAYFVSKVCKGTYNDYGSMRSPRDVYVITTAKKRDSKDWEREAIRFGITEDVETTIQGVTITVDSWNNLAKYTEVKDAFFIFDEQRVVGYGAWSKAFIKIAKSNEWVLLSATPGDTWLDYIPVFIANGWYKHKTDFTDQHVIWTPRVKYPKVLRYQNVGTLVRRRNDVLVHMPYERHTTRHSVRVKCDYDKNMFDRVVNKRWHVYEERPLRDVAEMFSVMRKVVNSDKSRLSELMSLMEKHPKIIVFYNFDYELKALRQLACKWTEDEGYGEECVPSGVAVAEWNGHKHEEIPANSARWVYLVQYRAGAEGWNCIETDAICFFSQTYSYRDWWQAHGRIDRLNTPFSDLYYYHLVSDSVIDKAIQRSLRVKKNFNERDLVL